MSTRRPTNNPLLDPFQRPGAAAADPNGLPPPPPYSAQQQQQGGGAGVYPPPGSQQQPGGYPPQGSQQYAPPPGPPPGVAPISTSSASPAVAAGPTPAPPANVRQQSSTVMGSVEALAKRMSMSLTPSSFSSSSRSTLDAAAAATSSRSPNPFLDKYGVVQSPTTMQTNPFSASASGGPSMAAQQHQNPFAGSTPARQGSVGRTSARAEEDPLTLLKSFDSVFIVDDSSSMHVNEQPDGSIGPSRWDEARDALAGVVELARHYDEDGVDIYFLNSEKKLERTRDPGAVRALFDSIDPEGPTPTGERLEMLLLEYWEELDAYAERKKRGALIPGETPPKKRNYIIITDGRPTDEPADVIVSCARRLDEGHYPLTQIGIQFLQVGNDAEATRALAEMDDELATQFRIRDMVDTTTYRGMQLSAEAITKALLGGINRRLDRQADPLQQQQRQQSLLL